MISSNTALSFPEDPKWESANPDNTFNARMGHTSTVLSNGYVLAVGGEDSEGAVIASCQIYNPYTNSWTNAADLNIARKNHTATLLLDGKVLVIGGSSVGTSRLDTAEVYDPKEDEWTLLTNHLTFPRSGHTATRLNDGRVVIAGGTASSTTIEVIDPSEDTPTFTAIGALANARHNHAAVLDRDGNIWFIFGLDNNESIVSSYEKFNPETGNSTLTTSTDSRSNFTATLMVNNRILVAGGKTSTNTALNTTLIIDTSDGSSTNGSQILLGRFDHSAVTLQDGRVVLIGGSNATVSYNNTIVYEPNGNVDYLKKDEDNNVMFQNGGRTKHTTNILHDGSILILGGTKTVGGAAIANADILRYGNDKLSNTNKVLATPRTMQASTVLADGKILVTGGLNDGDLSINSTEIYDTTSGVSAASDLNQERHNHTLTLLPDGRVMVIGGKDDTDYLDSVEIYNPASNTWSAADDLPDASAYHSVTVTRNNKVIVIGGENATATLDTINIYDLLTGTWSTATATLTTARSKHTATMLSNGKILIAGGENDADTALASLEIYDPSTDTIEAVTSEMPNARAGHKALMLDDDNIIFIGGSDSTAETDIYKVSTDSWLTTPPSLSEAKEDFAVATVTDGRIFVLGGSTNSESATKTIEVFDPVKKAWSISTIQLSLVRVGLEALFVPDFGVVLLGGSNGTTLLSKIEKLTDSFGASGYLKPTIANIELKNDLNINLSGNNFVGIEASNGKTDSSASNTPSVLTYSLMNGGNFVRVNSNTEINDTSFIGTSILNSSIISGPAYLALFSHGEKSNYTPFTLDYPVAKFKIEATTGGEIGNQIAGEEFNIKISALNSEDDIVSTFSEAITLTTNCEFDTGVQTVVYPVAGQVASAPLKLTKAAEDCIITATSDSHTEDSNEFAVTHTTFEKFLITNPYDEELADSYLIIPFSIKIRAADRYNNTITEFNESVDLSLTPETVCNDCEGLGTTPPLTNGILNNYGVLLTTAGDFALTVSEISEEPDKVSSSSNQFNVQPSDMATIVVTYNDGEIPDVEAGSEIPLTLTAYDEHDNVATRFNGVVTITSNKNTIASGGGVTMAFNKGVLHHSVVITQADTGYQLQIQEAVTPLNVTSNSFNVLSGPVAKFVISSTEDGDIGDQEIDIPFNVRIKAYDAYDNIATQFDTDLDPNATVELTCAGNTFSEGGGTVGGFVAGVLTSHAVALSEDGTNYALTVTNGELVATSNTFNVDGKIPASLTVTATDDNPITDQVAGVAFGVKVTVLDKKGRISDDLNTTIDLKVMNGDTVYLEQTGVPIINGVLSNFDIALTEAKAGYTVIATLAGTEKYPTLTASSNPFAINNGLLDHFIINDGLVPNQKAGVAFKIKVVAYDKFGNIAKDFTEKVNISSEASAGDGASENFNNGVLANHTMRYDIAGIKTITVNRADVSATSNSFSVEASDPIFISLVYASGGNIPSQTEGIPFEISAYVTDKYGNPVSTASGELNLEITNVNSGKTILITVKLEDGTLKNYPITINEIGTYIIKASASEFSTSTNPFYVTHQIPQTDGGEPGTFIINVKVDSGNLEDALVCSDTLGCHNTDANGNATFSNAVIGGFYTFKVTKGGYSVVPNKATLSIQGGNKAKYSFYASENGLVPTTCTAKEKTSERIALGTAQSLLYSNVRMLLLSLKRNAKKDKALKTYLSKELLVNYVTQQTAFNAASELPQTEYANCNAANCHTTKFRANKRTIKRQANAAKRIATKAKKQFVASGKRLKAEDKALLKTLPKLVKEITGTLSKFSDNCEVCK